MEGQAPAGAQHARERCEELGLRGDVHGRVLAPRHVERMVGRWQFQDVGVPEWS
jgi:hypothetical protein